MDIILTYEEQVQWNEIRDLYIYIMKHPIINDVHKNLIDTIYKGFIKLMTIDNKEIVMGHIRSLLIKTKHEFQINEEEQQNFNST
nr:hypothetical protein Datr000005 [Darna trima granulovirus]